MKISAVSQSNNSGIYETKNKPNISESFAEILEKKQKTNVDAKEFLTELTPSELSEVKKTNHLANNINIQTVSEEGAENLFLLPVDQYKAVDLNNDGIVEVGQAKMFVFPPPNTPENVKEAWSEASEGISSEEKMHLDLKLMAKQIEKNAYKKPDGTWAIRKSSDPGWINIFGNSKDSIISLCNELIDRIDNPLSFLTSSQKKEDETSKILLEKFINLIK